MAGEGAFDESGINRRFREVRERTEGPRGRLRFAKKIGESHSNVSRYERGRTLPGHVLARVVSAYGVSARWLLAGKGRMFAPTRADRIREVELTVPAANGGQAAVGRIKPTDRELTEFYVLPLLRDPTAAGPGRRITDDDVEGPAIIHRVWCPHPGRTDYVRVKGDSMEPVIPDGAIVTIDRSYTAAEALVGTVAAIYIAATEEVTIRRLQKDAVRPKRYIGVPDNMTRQNRPLILEEGDRIIGKVISVHALVK